MTDANSFKCFFAIRFAHPNVLALRKHAKRYMKFGLAENKKYEY